MRSYGVGISRKITFDANGVGTIPFTVSNTTNKTQPARDVYAFSTNKLQILAVPGCVSAPAIGEGWRDSYRCTLPSLKPGESRSWNAQVRYLPALERGAGSGGGQAGRAAPARLPVIEEIDVSTFCVIVVPAGAKNLSVVLGQDGPLRFVFGSSNDPNVISFTVTPKATSAGGTGGNGGTGSGSNGGNDPVTPTALPKTGAAPSILSMAGGALGLLILGFGLVGAARLRAQAQVLREASEGSTA
ncbi:hypothetical protein [Yinghuangia soli]|uniref:LPXTG cell wall anchor domain-containing protein n=1 Tax=Yinghuangia soli TaxID=2908204 RepID=A0AA41U2D5_9ACTN|nr:hypothetical protein [Yinghuangia soli]MCF2530565.1 hypothetical protein [Yinghuangia soli]